MNISAKSFWSASSPVLILFLVLFFYIFCLYSSPVLILCSSPRLLKSNSRMSSRILCLPNLISHKHSLLLFKRGKFLQKSIFLSYFCLLLYSFHSHAFNKKTPKLTSLFTLPISESISIMKRHQSKFHQIWVRVDF